MSRSEFNVGTANEAGLCLKKDKLICAAAAVILAFTVSSCSIKGSYQKESLTDSQRSSGSITLPAQSEKSDPKGQPSVKTGIITGTEPESSRTDNTEIQPKLSASAEYYLENSDEKIRRCYYEIYSGLIRYTEEIDITDGVISSDRFDGFMSLVICTSPEINQLDSDYSMIVDRDNYVKGLKVSYVKSAEEGGSELLQLKSEVESICLQAENMDDHEKLKYFHDRIILNCDYSDESVNSYSAYGCLIEGKAVCEGYSKAMLMLCERSGILCIPVFGSSVSDGTDTPHMWNKVLINKNWYNIDVTWDDPITSLGSDYIRYDYFNINDDFCSADHKAEESEYMKYPSADSDKENYYVRSGLLINGIDSAYIVFEKAAVQSMKNHERYIRIKCTSDNVYAEVYSVIFGGGTQNGSIFDILKSAAEKTGSDVSFNSYSLIQNEKMNTFTVILNQE